MQLIGQIKSEQELLKSLLNIPKDNVMSNRSTRTKLRYQMDKVSTGFKRIYEHLQYLDELAEDQSTYINDYLPPLVKALMEIEKGFERFREGL